jgi:hypothetical protein
MKNHLNYPRRKEILSVFLISILTISIFFTSQQLKSQIALSPYYLTSLLLPIPIMHYIYFKDHNRINSLIGRLIQDTALIALTCLFLFIFLRMNNILYKTGSLPNLITIITLWAIISETLFTVIYSIFHLTKKK